MSAGAIGLYSEEGQTWQRVSPGHAISEQWLQERAPDLSAPWWDTPSLAASDQIALQIEKRLEELEAAESWEKPRVAAPGRDAVVDAGRQGCGARG